MIKEDTHGIFGICSSGKLKRCEFADRVKGFDVF